MLKYCFKVFDPNGDLVIQTICPASDMMEVLAALKEYGTVKGFVMEDNSDV